MFRRMANERDENFMMKLSTLYYIYIFAIWCLGGSWVDTQRYDVVVVVAVEVCEAVAAAEDNAVSNLHSCRLN